MVRRRRRKATSQRRFIMPYQFNVLLRTLQVKLEEVADGSIRKVFPVLESLAGIVGRKTMLEAVRWQQAGLVRLVEAVPLATSKRRAEYRTFEGKVMFYYSVNDKFYSLKTSYNI